MAKKITESQLYPILGKWAVRNFKCFHSSTNVGLRYSRADVLCIRDISGHLTSECETIVIEVKKGGAPFATVSGQAYGYSVYANRVYLAEHRTEPFSDAQRQIAAQLGIGLIHVSTSLKCTEVQMSPRYEPLPSMNSELLEKIGFGSCRICGVLFRIGSGKKSAHSLLAREDIEAAVDKGRGLVFWNVELGERKRKAKLESYSNKTGHPSYERRFICGGCIENLWSPLVGEEDE